MSTIIAEKSFAPEARYSNFYAGSDVVWSADGKLIYCLNTTAVNVVEVATGQVVRTFSLNDESAVDTEDIDEDIIYTFALSPYNEHLATAHRSGLLRLWSLQSGEVTKLWKGQHKGPIVKVHFSPCSNLLCSSGADSTLRIWDFTRSHCVGVFKDIVGPCVLFQFHPSMAKTEIFAAGADHTIYCINYAEKKLIYKLSGHLSQITSLSFKDQTADCEYLTTVSKDKVLIVWKLQDGTQHKLIPLYEELEGVCYVGLKHELFVASTNGNLKLVHTKTGKSTTLLEDNSHEIKYLLQCAETKELAVVTTEQNILIYKLTEDRTIECVKQLIGFNDDILDMCFSGDQDRFLAVATNSKSFKVYDTAAQMNCKIVTGHTDTVLTISAAGSSNLLLTAGKDYNIILWEILTTPFDVRCLAKNSNSHTSAIGCLSFGYNNAQIFASVCQDGSMKVWQLSSTPSSSSAHAFHLQYAALAHDKDVNCVAFSPNNKIIATASQDKTARLWSSEQHASLGVLRGHTRGVWCVRFSPIDQVVLTSSGDCSMRIWSLSTLACLKRLEQECTILRAEFIDQGRFIASAASDGLIKIWNIKSNECVSTLDAHKDRVWCLAVPVHSRKYFYSGGADSCIIKWQDVTEQSQSVAIEKRQQQAEQEQTLQTLLHAHSKNFQKAFVLALTLGKPKTTFNILNQFIKRREHEAIQTIITDLDVDKRNTLVDHIKAWSTNSRHCKVAGVVLQYLLTDLIANPKQRNCNVHNLVEVLTPYVQRHFGRATEMNNNLSCLDFIVQTL